MTAADIQPIKLDALCPKKLKVVLKEAGKKAQDVAGVADMGGLDFFATFVDSCEGDVDFLRAAMDAMNAEVDPNSEERKGGAGHVGKMILSSSEKVATVGVCAVPEDKVGKLSAKEWVEHVASTIKADVIGATETYGYFQMKYDMEAGRFPLKERDNAISASTGLLRSKGLMIDDDSDDECCYGDGDFPCDDEEEVTEAVAAMTIAPVDTEALNPKKLKVVLKEAGKKAQDVAGVADLGGLDFFATFVESAEGDVTFLRAAMDAMNVEVDPTSEERKGGAGHVGKMLLSSSEKVATVGVCHIPKDKQAKLTAKTWVEHVANRIQATVLECDDGYGYFEMKYDMEAGRFPLKERDNAISAATSLLREKGFMPDDDSDDDECCYGDGDFPCDF